MPIVLDRTFQVEKASSAYPSIGTYSREPYSFVCSPSVKRTGRNFYKSIEALAEMIKEGELPEDARFMLQHEGRTIEKSYLKQGKDPRKAEEFNDYFVENDEERYLWEWTSTGLRVPKGWENGRVDAGTKKYPRLVIEADVSRAVKMLRDGTSWEDIRDGTSWEDIGDSINRVTGELLVPSGGGKVIMESDEIFGIPTETRDISYPHEGYYAHWWLDPSPRLDEISGHHDVAVGRGSCWLLAVGERCLSVNAVFERWDAASGTCFRPVRGSVPEIKAELEKADQEYIDQAIESIKRDSVGLSKREFMKKYTL